MHEDVREAAEKFVKKFKVDFPSNVIVKGKRLYLASKELQDFLADVPLDSFSVGLPLGELSTKGFMPSLALLDLLKDSENKLVIKDDAEWLFTCGRDIFADKVLRKGDHLKEPFLIVNKKNEVLGLGKFDHSDKKGTILNVMDRGDFLRREEKRKNVKRK